MVASSDFGNVFSVLIASAWLPYVPMTGLQILIQNLLYDISQIAIPWDRMDEEYLLTPQVWNVKDILRFVLVLGPTSSTIDMCTFSLNWFYYGIRTANSGGVAGAHTNWFLQGLLTQTLIVHMLRTAKIPLFPAPRGPRTGFHHGDDHFRRLRYSVHSAFPARYVTCETGKLVRWFLGCRAIAVLCGSAAGEDAVHSIIQDLDLRADVAIEEPITWC